MRLTNKLLFSAAAGVGALVALRAFQRRRNRISFYGRSVLITGGSRGLGLVLARQLADEGALLTIMSRDVDEVITAAQELTERGARVLALRGDVRDQRIAQEAVDRAIAEYGRIDLLINDAGVIQAGPLEHMTNEDFENAMAVHLWGPYYTMQAAIPHMRRQGGGRIVNIASIGGKVAVPHLVPYSTSKFALVGLSDGMRAELAKDGILVTTVNPGLMRTGSHVNALFRGQHRREFTWFSLLDSLPFSSIDARRAARQIVEAARHGAPSLTITMQARALEIANTLFPWLTAEGLKLMNRVLPAPTGEKGDELRTGWESQSPLSPSVATKLADEATMRNNNDRPSHRPLE